MAKQMTSNAPNTNNKNQNNNYETLSADDMIDGLIDPNELIAKAKEGNKKQVTHYVKERIPSFRKAKIKQFLSKDSTLSCKIMRILWFGRQPISRRMPSTGV